MRLQEPAAKFIHTKFRSSLYHKILLHPLVKSFNRFPCCNVQIWHTFSYCRIVLNKQDKPITQVQTLIKNCQLATGIGNLKWLKCSELCAVSDEMSPLIQFRSQTAFSDSLELHLSALETADTILIKRHNTIKFLPPSLNIALWGL